MLTDASTEDIGLENFKDDTGFPDGRMTPLPPEISSDPSLWQKAKSYLLKFDPVIILLLNVIFNTVSGVEFLSPPAGLIFSTLGSFFLYSFIWNGLQKNERDAVQLKSIIRNEINNNNLNYNFEFNVNNQIDPELMARAGRIASQLGIVVTAVNFPLHALDTSPNPSLSDPLVATRTITLFLGGACTAIGFFTYVKSGKKMFELAEAKHTVEKLIMKNDLEVAELKYKQVVRDLENDEKRDSSEAVRHDQTNGRSSTNFTNHT